MSHSHSELLATLNRRADLTPAQIGWVFGEMMAGRCGDVESAAILLALHLKGESAAELAEAARVLREHMVCWDPERDDVIDTCGTGGDGASTFNISTAAALVVAAVGVPVVKHGNRSASGRFGSADVLEALGVKIDGDAEFARRCLKETNFAFCLAPRFHPSLQHLAAVRRRLGVPTICNYLGPLANPAGVKRQVLGVGKIQLLDPMANALAELGCTHAFVLCSEDGLDEIDLAAPTAVREIRTGKITPLTWTAADFELEKCSPTELFAPHVQASVDMIKGIIAGNECGAFRVVLANAAAALLAADRVSALAEGVAAARNAIATGKARMALSALRQISAD